MLSGFYADLWIGVFVWVDGCAQTGMSVLLVT
jgi:hypothetical protein